ncbi:hypothetical protein M0813_04704 [Anaeramoeba flamelloides]|uniref:Transposase n=1 Tax=Anaeramoeba flamelloides TaxID=1746091 RepID=A0ABQ8XJ56_9EUKA|nr:hypothetical protein M0813_04704 [Anaeramoeba flamelloides]
MSEKRKQPNTNNSKITIITEEEIRKMYSSEVPRDYSHNKRKRKSYEKEFKQVIKMYQDPSISALNREGNTILWDWIKKHLVMEGDEKTYPEILAPLKGPYIRRHIIGLLENKKYRSGKATSVSRAAVYRWMNLRGLYCKSIDHVEDRPKSEEDKQRDNTRFFQTYTHYIEENELTSDRIWCMDETPCQHSDTPKKSFKLRNSKSFSKTHGFNQRDTLVACIRADGARLAPMIIETRNAYLNKKDSSKSREKIGGMSEDFMIFWLETRANCLPHMHNYTRILRLLIISKYYYDATGESVRGNFIKNGLALWKKGCTEKIESINNNLYPGVKIIKPTLKTRMDDIRFNGLTVKPHKGFVIYFLNGIRCDFTDLKKLSEDDNFGLKHRKKYQNFIDQNESEKDEFFRVCTDIQMNNMKTNSQKGKKRVRNAGKTTLSQPIFTEERFEVRPQSKKKTTPPKRKKKARNAGKTSLSQPIFTEDQLEERPQSKKEDNFAKKGRKEKKCW